MLEEKKVQESLDRHVFSENPFDEKTKARLTQGVKGSKFRRNSFPVKPALSICALISAAAIFMFFVSQNSWQGPGESSSASWAYPFVKLDGETYVITDKTVPAVGKQIGVVTSHSDREAADTSGNFSNAVEKGTKMYSIPRVSVDKAIAVEKESGLYIEAISRDTWERKNLFDFASSWIQSLGQYKSVQIKDVRGSAWGTTFREYDKSQRAVRVKTNLGVIDAVFFPNKKSEGIEVQSNVTSTGFTYKINGKKVQSPDRLYFTLYGHWFFVTESEKLNQILKIEKRFVEKSVLANIDWKVSGTFSVEGNNGHKSVYRGIKGKMGFTDAPFYVGDTQKYLWRFWGEKLRKMTGEVKIVAVHQTDGQKAKALIGNQRKVWGYGRTGAGFPSSMSLPSSGLWSLNVFVGDQYIDDIVINVKNRSAVKSVEDFLAILKLYRGVTLKGTSDSRFADIFENSQSAEINTNLGKLNVAVLNENHLDLPASDVSTRERPGRYNYSINGKPINSPSEIFSPGIHNFL